MQMESRDLRVGYANDVCPFLVHIRPMAILPFVSSRSSVLIIFTALHAQLYLRVLLAHPCSRAASQRSSLEVRVSAARLLPPKSTATSPSSNTPQPATKENPRKPSNWLNTIQPKANMANPHLSAISRPVFD
ncbi:MAG: hypothetical protein BYD32DRAFT_476754 [Podila humilis]|nr:MAG: hypothetical protein BYD32DRAFT_476754 [Podila humilis]